LRLWAWNTPIFEPRVKLKRLVEAIAAMEFGLADGFPLRRRIVALSNLPENSRGSTPAPTVCALKKEADSYAEPG
jgi:hypothetical protein